MALETNDNSKRYCGVKSVAEKRMQKTRHYFDSADWMMEMRKGKEYHAEKMPPKFPPSTDSEEEDKEQEQPTEQMEVAKIINQRALRDQKERKFFDSADWALTGEKPPTKTCPIFPQPKACSVLTKRKLSKSKKYFDSADWALAGASYIPQVQPKLTLLKS